MPKINVCEICNETINFKRKTVQCTECGNLFHMNCVKLNNTFLDSMKSKDQDWQCISCSVSLSKIEISEVKEGITSSQEIMIFLEKNIKSIKNQQEEFIRGISESMEFLSNAYTDIRKLVEHNNEKSAKNHSQLGKTSSENSQLPSKIESLANRLVDLEILASAKTLEVDIPPISTDEDVALIKRVGRGLGININDEMIDFCYRPKSSPKNKKPEKIIVRFVRQIDKERFINAREMKNSFSTEHLQDGRDNHQVQLQEKQTLKRTPLQKRNVSLLSRPLRRTRPERKSSQETWRRSQQTPTIWIPPFPWWMLPEQNYYYQQPRQTNSSPAGIYRHPNYRQSQRKVVDGSHQLTPRRMAAQGKEAGEQPVTIIPQEQDKDKDRKKMEEDLKHFNILFGVTQGIGLLCVVLMLVWLSTYRGGFGWSASPDLQFNWHPLLMTIGFIYLFANSIMIYRALRSMRKQKLKLIHACIHGAVVLCVIIAQIAVFSFHNAKGYPNLYSLHSWMGLTAVILYIGQWVASILIYLYPGAPLPIRGAVMPWHVFLGLFAFILVLATSLSGILEKVTFVLGEEYSKLPGEAVLVNIIGMLFILFGVLVVYITTETKFKRHPRPEDGALLNTSPTE